MVKAPQGIRYAEEDGSVNEKAKGAYEAIAKGGVGMIVLGGMSVEPAFFMSHQIGIFDDKFIPGLTDFTNTMHKYNCPIFAQLFHVGPSAQPAIFGIPPVGASSLSMNERPCPGAPVQGLTISEIEDLVEKFVKTAERAQLSGFDGVEVHGAHAYLLESFLSRAWNKRDDKYGCQDLQSRARIVVDIIQLIKKRCGADFPVGVRINGEEFETEKGLTSEENVEIAKILAEAGADYISVSGYGYGNLPFRFMTDIWLYPEPPENLKPYRKRLKKPGMLIPAAEAIKKEVSVPVIGVGNITAELAEWLLRNGKIDLVALGRALFADSEFPNKLCSGRLEDIAPCTHCGTCYPSQTLELRRCRINPAMGREQEYAEYNMKPAKEKKRVMVVGGGPAGMEAARVAALRGHKVSLYEKEPRLGGLLPLAALVKGLEIEDLPAIVRYLRTQLNKLGVDIRLGKEVTPALVDEIKPDVIILATGGTTTVPKIPGIDKKNVISSAQLRSNVKNPLQFFGPKVLRWLTKLYLPMGTRVVLIGGQLEGYETAEFLVKRGRQVTIIEASDKKGTGMPGWYLERITPWFAAKGVKVVTGIKYEQITDEGLTIVTNDGERQTIKADTIIVTMPPQPNTSLYETLKGKVPEIYLIGSGKGEESKLIVDAFADGRSIGCAV
jgi:2,4-dienoyl-CoA reductase (NADPH2)